MNSKVLKRYGSALYDAYIKAGRKESFLKDCLALHKLILENRDLSRLLKSPVVKKIPKTSLIKEIFNKKIDALLLNFMVLLVKNGREMYLGDILNTFLEMIDTKNGIIKPVFSTAVELKEAERKNIKKRIDDVTLKNSMTVYNLDTELIGGFTVRIDDTVYDGSIKRQLELMKKSLKTQSN
jgi:F-type H+-transporting ATPase subunit delta